MSVQIVAAVRAQYGATVTKQECVYICNEVAWILNGNVALGPWGLQRAPSGVDNQWNGARLDKIVARDTGEVVDILGGASTGQGSPQWGPIPGAVPDWMRLREDWLPSAPPPQPQPPNDLAGRVADLESRMARLESRFRGAGEVMVGL